MKRFIPSLSSHRGRPGAEMDSDTIVVLAALAIFLAYAIWTNRPRQLYRSSHRFYAPPEEVFRAYFPQPGDDLKRFEDDGTEFLEHGLSHSRIRLSSGRVHVWETEAPRRAVARPEPESPALDTETKIYTFSPVEGGTRLDFTMAVRRGRLLTWGMEERLAGPFIGLLESKNARISMATASAALEEEPAVPMVARSRTAVVLAALAIAYLTWSVGWIGGLGVAFVIFVHELGHVFAARWYGHRTSSFIFVPFLGGLANTGPSATHGEQVVKVLAGPLFGLIGCGLIAWLVTFLNDPNALRIVVVIVTVHFINLLPVGMLDGGQLMRSITLSLGRRGRVIWLAVGASLLAAGAYLAIWVLGSWLLLPVLIGGAIILVRDHQEEDRLPKLGWKGLIGALAGWASLSLAHVLPIAYIVLVLIQTFVIVVERPERVTGLYRAPTHKLIFWNVFRGWSQWPAQAGPPDWGANLLAGANAGTTFSLPESMNQIRVVLADGRECLARAKWTLLFSHPTLTLDDATISELECYSPVGN